MEHSKRALYLARFRSDPRQNLRILSTNRLGNVSNDQDIHGKRVLTYLLVSGMGPVVTVLIAREGTPPQVDCASRPQQTSPTRTRGA